MKVTKKIIACVLIIIMISRLPKAEAMAADTFDVFTKTTIGLGYQGDKSRHTDCRGMYTILSPCSQKKLVFPNTDLGGSAERYGGAAYDQQLSLDHNDALPWNNVSEPPAVGILIPILHF